MSSVVVVVVSESCCVMFRCIMFHGSCRMTSSFSCGLLCGPGYVYLVMKLHFY